MKFNILGHAGLHLTSFSQAIHCGTSVRLLVSKYKEKSSGCSGDPWGTPQTKVVVKEKKSATLM